MLGPSVYELLNGGEGNHKQVEALFLECKKAVDEAIHQMDEKVRKLYSKHAMELLRFCSFLFFVAHICFRPPSVNSSPPFFPS